MIYWIFTLTYSAILISESKAKLFSKLEFIYSNSSVGVQQENYLHTHYSHMHNFDLNPEE